MAGPEEVKLTGVASNTAIRQAPPPSLSRHPYQRADRNVRNKCLCGHKIGHRIHFVRRCEESPRLEAPARLCEQCCCPMETGRTSWARFCKRWQCRRDRAREFSETNNQRRAEARAVALGR